MRTKSAIEIPVEIRDHLRYDPDTGVVTWVKPLSPRTPVDTQVVGKQVSFKGTGYSLGRVIYTLMGDPIPKGYHVHHLNGDRDDYRWENLGYYEIGFPKVLKIKDGYAVVCGTLPYGKYHSIENARKVAWILVEDQKLA